MPFDIEKMKQAAGVSRFDIEAMKAAAEKNELPAYEEKPNRAGNFFKAIGQTISATPYMIKDTFNQSAENYADWNKKLIEGGVDPLDVMKGISTNTNGLKRKADELGIKVDDKPVSQDSEGMRRLAQANESQRKSLDGLSPTGQFVGETLFSVAQNAALLPSGLINPAIPLAGMAAISTAQKQYELAQKGIGASQSQGRGVLSGSIEALTEAIPVGNILKILKEGAGESLIKTLLKQMGTEGTEEMVSYVANYIADVAAKDPDAKFSLPDMVRQGASGFLSGGIMGGGAAAVNTAVNKLAPPKAQPTPQQVQQAPTQQAQQMVQPMEQSATERAPMRYRVVDKKNVYEPTTVKAQQPKPNSLAQQVKDNVKKVGSGFYAVKDLDSDETYEVGDFVETEEEGVEGERLEFNLYDSNEELTAKLNSVLNGGRKAIVVGDSDIGSDKAVVTNARVVAVVDSPTQTEQTQTQTVDPTRQVQPTVQPADLSLGVVANLPDFTGAIQNAQAYLKPNKPNLTGDRRSVQTVSMLDALGTGESAFDGVEALYEQSKAEFQREAKDPDKIAGVLTETPKKAIKQSFADDFDWFMRKAVDVGHTIAKAGKQINDDLIYPLFFNASQSRKIAEAMIGEFQTDINGNRSGKSLKEIFAPIRAKGADYFKAFETYLYHMHNIDRMAVEKPVFGEAMTADDSRDRAFVLLRDHPEFAQTAQEIYAYNQNLMKYRVDAGLLSQAQADQMIQLYPHYVPTFRDVANTSSANQKGNTVQIAQSIKKAKGSNLDLMPIDDSMARQTIQTVGAAKKNLFGLRLLEGALKNRDRVGQYVQGIEDYGSFYDMDDPVELNDRFTIYLKGKPVSMALNQGMMEGVSSLAPKFSDGKIVDAVVAANTLFKQLITGYNPLFTARNFFRDIQDAVFYSKDLQGLAKNYPKAVQEMKNNGKLWQLYKSMGGFGSSFYDYEKGISFNDNKFGFIEELNIAVEQAPRFAEFMSVIDNGGTGYENVLKALMASADITVNFGRGGSWAKQLNRTIVPFVNPAIQGTDKLIRTFSEAKGAQEWAMLIGKAAVFGVLPAAINGLLWKDDEEYQSISSRNKDVNYIFKIKDGLWIKIPRGRAIAWAGNAARRGLTGEGWIDFIDTTVEATAPANPFESNLFSPIGRAKLLDKSDPGKTWYGGNIETQSMRNVEPRLRYNENTDELSKMIGNALNISPVKINNLLDGYTGVIGDFLLPLATKRAERSPLANAFTIDPVIQNRYSTDFYKEIEKATYAKNDPNPHPEASLVSRYLNRQSDKASDIYAEIRKVENSNLKDSQKKEQVRELRKSVNALHKSALDSLEKYKKAAQKYSSLEPDTAYREANREVFGAEYALQAYHKDVYEKAKKANNSLITYDTFYNVYFAQKDIEGDKDKSGKTIPLSSSRKKKAIIDKASLNTQQKKLLYEMFDISKQLW